MQYLRCLRTRSFQGLEVCLVGHALQLVCVVTHFTNKTVGVGDHFDWKNVVEVVLSQMHLFQHLSQLFGLVVALILNFRNFDLYVFLEF